MERTKRGRDERIVRLTDGIEYDGENDQFPEGEHLLFEQKLYGVLVNDLKTSLRERRTNDNSVLVCRRWEELCRSVKKKERREKVDECFERDSFLSLQLFFFLFPFFFFFVSFFNLIVTAVINR